MFPFGYDRFHMKINFCWHVYMLLLLSSSLFFFLLMKLRLLQMVSFRHEWRCAFEFGRDYCQSNKNFVGHSDRAYNPELQESDLFWFGLFAWICICWNYVYQIFNSMFMVFIRWLTTAHRSWVCSVHLKSSMPLIW